MDILSTGALVERYLEIVSSATDIGLTSESASIINVTGTSPQEIVLPDATTCFLGTTFTFTNNSTGVLSLYLADAPETIIEAGEELVVGADEVLVVSIVGQTLFTTVAPGATLAVRLTDIATIPGTWVTLTNTSATVDLQSVYDASGASPSVNLIPNGLLFSGNGPVNMFNTYGLNVVSTTHGLTVQFGGTADCAALIALDGLATVDSVVILKNNASSSPHIRFDGATSGSVYLKAPDSIIPDYTLTLPTAPPTSAGYTLVSTDNLGTLTWGTNSVPAAGDFIDVVGATISVKRHAPYLNSSGTLVSEGDIVFLRDNGGGVLEIMELADAQASNTYAPDSVVGIVKDTSIANGATGNVIVVHGFEEYTSTVLGTPGKDAYISPLTPGTLVTDLSSFTIGDHVISVGKFTDDAGHVLFAPRYVMTF